MAKLEGFERVVVVKYDCSSCKYHFALYDDGVDYNVGDMVVLSNGSTPAKIAEIISAEEAKERYKSNITAEVIGKVDTSAYDERIAKRKEKERLKKELDKRKKEIQKRLDDEYYASKDETYAEMLKQYNDF